MPVRVNCGQCGQAYDLRDESRGKQFNCRGCGSVVRVPRLHDGQQAPGNSTVNATFANIAEQTIFVSCQCGKSFNANSSLAGKTAKCPSCGLPLTIPSPNQVAAPPQNELPGIGSASQPSMETVGPLGSPSPTFAQPAMPVQQSPSFTYPAAAQPRSGRSKGLIIGLMLGGGAIVGLLAIVVVVALLLPAIKAARDAARQTQARRSSRFDNSSGLPRSAPTKKWISYERPPDGYSVSFPRYPMQRMSFQMGVRTTTAFCDLREQGAYMVALSRSPLTARADTFDDKAALDAGVNGAIKSSNGKLISSKEITLDGHLGREIRFEGQQAGKQFSACGRIYVVDRRVYQVMWIGSKGSSPGSDLQKFYDSFQLLDQTSGSATESTDEQP